MEKNIDIDVFINRYSIQEEPDNWDEETIKLYMQYGFCNRSAYSYASKEEIERITPVYIKAFRNNHNVSLVYHFIEGVNDGSKEWKSLVENSGLCIMC